MDYLELDSRKCIKNLKYWQRLAQKNNIKLNVVTKFFLSNPLYVQMLAENGVDTISDSNISNFSNLPKDIRSRLTCCGIKTRPSDCAAGTDGTILADRLLVSDEACLKKLALLPAARCPKIVLIMECGDLKDGLYPERIKELVLQYKSLPIIGVSVNFACLSGKMPDLESLHQLAETAAFIKQQKNLEKAFVSVGGTVMHDMLASGILAQGEHAGLISEVRCGEGIFFGNDSSKGAPIEGLEHNVFKLRAEIIEVQEKLVPQAENTGLTALGAHSEPRPAGKRRCAVVDFGILAASKPCLFAEDADIITIGQTFDFSVFDVTDSKSNYEAGGFITFGVNYGSASFLCMNQFVAKVLL